jgi:predicted AlkP superfamily phosphohydrolase/phosphomutase
MEQDKQRSIVNRNREIKRAKSVMGRTKDKVLKKQLKQQIKKLENENKETQRFL